MLHPKYRSDIDGLRALAVMAVVLFHYFPTKLKAGFIGVDIFFVISGYLISTIILGSLSRKEFSLSEFYARRIRRIFPALLLVLAACLIAGWFLLWAGDYAQLGKHAAAGAGFIANITLWREAGYFDATALEKPLLHLWSLGIEEQFYLLWPPLLMALYKFRLTPFWPCLIVFLLSFAAGVYIIPMDKAAGFYSPLLRMWELTAGCLLAILTLHRPLPLTRQITQLLSISGAACIAVGLILIHEQRLFPGWWALLPVAGTWMLIAAGPNALFNRLLSFPPIVWIGLISYPLYLWHWPLLVFARLENYDLSLAWRLGLLVASVVLAWLTYALLEKHIRHTKHSIVTPTLVVLMIVVGAAGYTIHQKRGFDSQYPEIIREASKLKQVSVDHWREHECFLEPMDSAEKFAEACNGVRGKPHIFIWGDSQAAALYPGLKHFTDTHDIALSQYTASFCAPLLGVENPYRNNCTAVNQIAIKKIVERKPDIVLLHAAWRNHPHYEYSQLKDTIQAIQKAGVPHVLVVGLVPQWYAPLPRLVARYWKRHFPHEMPPLYMKFGLREDTPYHDSELRKAVMPLGADYIALSDLLCNDDGCLTRTSDKGDGLTSFDINHLSPSASVYVAYLMSDYFTKTLNLNVAKH